MDPFQILTFVFAILLTVAIVFFFILPPGRAWGKVFASRLRVWPFPFIGMWIAGIDVIAMAHLYRRARRSNVRVSLWVLEDMFHAEVDAREIVEAFISARNGNEDITIHQLIQHSLAGGHVGKVVDGLIAAKNADANLSAEEKMKLNFDVIAAIDLADVDVQQAIDDYVHPKVIETDPITAVAQNEIQLTAKVRITLKTDLYRIVSGADKDTIKSRVNEGVVTVIGQADSHKQILENTYLLGEKIMANKALWEDGAYDVISVDVIDLQVGRDVGSELRARRAESEMSVHRAKEQEMKAMAAEAEVLRIKAESEVQQAMADAFRDGNLSIHDYHNMQNKEADTLMRKAFSKQPHKEPKRFNDDDDDDDDNDESGDEHNNHDD